MFNNSTVPSAWGQPAQNQLQQQPATNAFGQPATGSAFGATNAFGTGGTFGQPQQPQQQQQSANPMFGGLGGTTAAPATGATGFGGFGNTAPAATGNSIFGAPKPTTGFGAFGGGGTAFGTTTNTYGAGAGTAATGTSIFGAQPTATSTSTFGAPAGGIFGAKPTATTFGAAAGATTENVAPVTTGTLNPPYSAYTEKDPVNNGTTLEYQSVSCMPPYRGSSFEELRTQDYQQGRKTAGVTGQSAFGAQPATGLFGQPAAAQPTNSIFGGFGAANNTTTGTTTNAFGGFGQPAAGTSTQPATTGNLFGQQQQPQQNTGFGAFGQQQQPQQSTSGGLFGGAFGTQAQQPKPFGTFGATNTTTNAFGTTGAFGQANQQQPATTGTNLFGQPQQQQAQPSTSTAFGGFGNANAPKPSLFGPPQPQQQQQQQPTGFTGFGQQPQQNQPAQPGTQPTGGLFGTGAGLFGQNNQQQQQQQQPTGSLFGAQPAQPATGNSLFGGNTTGGLFGNTTNQQQPQQQQQQPGTTGFGLFGQKPATTGTTTGGFGGFGQSNTTSVAPTQQQGSLFSSQLGQTATQPANSLFGASNNLFARPATTNNTQPAQQQQTTGFPLFGNTLGNQVNQMGQPALAAQPSLTASIAQPIGANLPIFNMLPPGPRAISLDPPKKKSSLFADVPTRSPVPRLQLGYTPATSRLRGFTSTSTIIPGANGQPLGAAVSLTSGRPGALSMSKAGNNRSILGPDAFVNGSMQSPGLGSGGKQSVKKLILDRKVEPSDLFGKTAPKVTFNAALSVAAREAEAAAASGSALRRDETPIPASRSQQRASNKFSAQPEVADKGAEGDTRELKEGDYYVRPSLSELKKKSFAELGHTEGLVVGRVGYGEIEFLEPVDLTGLRKTTELLGDVVRFDDKECSVYPDSSETDKPPPGSGLNVAARITLVHCWALDKATREPIKDEKHPMAVKHLKRLKNIKKTHFESFDLEEGKWVFTVDHF